MQAVVLAGGEGKRLRSYYHNLPKPLVPVKGKPLITYTLDKIIKAGIREIYIVIRQKDKKKFTQSLKDYSEIEYLYQRKPQGTAKALLPAEEVIKNDFLLSYCDLITSFNYKRLIEFHQKQKPFATLVLNKDKNRDNEVLVTKGKVMKIVEKPQRSFSEYTAIGVMCLGIKIFKYIKQIKPGKNNEYNIGDALQLAIENGEDVFAVLTSAFRKNVNSPEDLNLRK